MALNTRLSTRKMEAIVNMCSKNEASAEPATLTSSELCERTKVSQQTINYLRKEGVLYSERPPAAKAKSDGFLYRESDVAILKQAMELGTEKTFIHSVKMIQAKKEIADQASQIITALCSINEKYKSGEQLGQDGTLLLSNLVVAILNLDGLSTEERSLMSDLIQGKYRSSDVTTDDNLAKRRMLDQAKLKIADLLLTLVRLAALETVSP